MTCLWTLACIAICVMLPIHVVNSFKISTIGSRMGQRLLVTRQSNQVVRLAAVVECKTPEFDFKEQIKTKWAVVDFYADWCGPCKIAARTFQSIAEEYPDKSVRFIKVDTEVFEDSVDDYGLKGLPVFGVFKDGKLVKKHEGNIGKDKLLEFIQAGLEV